jgi:hypothetical protein
MATAMWFIRQQQRKQCGKRNAKDVAIIWCGAWQQSDAETAQIRSEKLKSCDCCHNIVRNRATASWGLWKQIGCDHMATQPRELWQRRGDGRGMTRLVAPAWQALYCNSKTVMVQYWQQHGERCGNVAWWELWHWRGCLLWKKVKVVATARSWLPHHSVSGYNIGIIGIAIP